MTISLCKENIQWLNIGAGGDVRTPRLTMAPLCTSFMTKVVNGFFLLK